MQELTMIQKMPHAITRSDVDGDNIKYIEGTNDMFAVSRLGMCFSFTYKMQGRPIGTLGPQGYPTACILYEDGKRRTVYIHRLVAQAFLPNPENKRSVRHKNEDRTDNRVENLAWCTSEENFSAGSHNEKLAASIKEYYRNRNSFGRSPIRVVVMNKNEEVLEISPSIQAAADWIKKETGKDDNASAMQISCILQGKPGFRTVGGFKVRKASEEEYKDWVASHMNTLLQEEDVTLSDIQLNRLSKIDGVKVVNRRMNVETGEMEYDIRTFNKGDKITNNLY